MKTTSTKKKVYCENCAYFLKVQGTTDAFPLCVAKAYIVGNAVSRATDVAGVAVATVRNKHNNCRLFLRHSPLARLRNFKKHHFIRNYLQTPASPAEMPVLRSAPSRPKKKAPPALTAQTVAEIVAQQVEPLVKDVDRLIKQQKKAKIKVSEGPHTEEASTSAPQTESRAQTQSAAEHAPFVRVREAPPPSSDVPRQLAPRSPGTEEPDTINGPM